jgi:hypothetical protein
MDIVREPLNTTSPIEYYGIQWSPSGGIEETPFDGIEETPFGGIEETPYLLGGIEEQMMPLFGGIEDTIWSLSLNYLNRTLVSFTQKRLETVYFFFRRACGLDD